jgi:hypothetical protein
VRDGMSRSTARPISSGCICMAGMLARGSMRAAPTPRRRQMAPKR